MDFNCLDILLDSHEWYFEIWDKKNIWKSKNILKSILVVWLFCLVFMNNISKFRVIWFELREKYLKKIINNFEINFSIYCQFC